jgi:hypothetical protein
MRTGQGKPRCQQSDVNVKNITDNYDDGFSCMYKMGKKASGRILDGVIYSEFPKG